MRVCAALHRAPLPCALRVLPQELHGWMVTSRTCASAATDGAALLSLAPSRSAGACNDEFWRRLAAALPHSSLDGAPPALCMAHELHRKDVPQAAWTALHVPVRVALKATLALKLFDATLRVPDALRSAVWTSVGKLVLTGTPHLLRSQETGRCVIAAESAARRLAKAAPPVAWRALGAPRPRRRIANRHVWVQVQRPPRRCVHAAPHAPSL